MKKRILCLVLALLMVLPMLVACGGDEDVIGNINEEASRYTTTLNMWMITESQLIADASKLIVAGITPDKKEEKLTDEEKAKIAALSPEQKEAWEQLNLVNNEINKLTKAKYKTKLNIKYFTESEYYAAVEKGFADHDAYIKEHKTGVLPNQTEETELNEYGIPELKYPTVLDCEVDILFIGNAQKYTQYISQNLLVELQTYFAESVELYSYINNDFLVSANYNSMVYALPNYHGIGEYVYVMADKEMLDQYNADNKLSSATIYDSSFKDYLDYIAAEYGSSGVYPIYVDTADKTIPLSYTHYWSFDAASKPGYVTLNPDKFSIMGDSYFGGHFDSKTALESTNLLANKTYMQSLATKVYYENTAGYITNTASAKGEAAVHIVTGGWELKQQYEEAGYEVMVMQYPQMTDDQVFESMFAVGAYTIDAARSAEIIAFLNTNSEIRNLFQYGVEGENYTLATTKVGDKEYSYVVEDPNNLYKMDLKKTGNVFMAYPNSEATAAQWDYQKQQNLEMQTYPTLAFCFSTNFKLDEEAVLVMSAVSEKMEAYLNSMTDYAQIMEVYNRAKGMSDRAMAKYIYSECLGNIEIPYTYNGEENYVSVATLLSALSSYKVSAISEKKDALQSPYALYVNWATVVGMVEEKKTNT